MSAMEEIGVGSGVGSDGGFDLRVHRCGLLSRKFHSLRGLHLAKMTAGADFLPRGIGPRSRRAERGRSRELPRPGQIADLKPLGDKSR